MESNTLPFGEEQVKAIVEAACDICYRPAWAAAENVDEPCLYCPVEVAARRQVDSLRTVAEKESRLIILPCKMGTKLWMIVTKRPKISRPEFFFIKQTRLTETNLFRIIRDFGKDVFLTREEAVEELTRRKICAEQINAVDPWAAFEEERDG